MDQQKLNDLFKESLKKEFEISKSPGEVFRKVKGDLMLYGIVSLGNFTYNTASNLFNKYITVPREQLRTLTIQNEIMIQNQSEFLDLIKRKSKQQE